MNDSTILDAVARERFFYAVETAHQVVRRYQFFLWAQGALQGVVPHGSLICAYGDLLGGKLRYQEFAAAGHDTRLFDALTEPAAGPITALVGDWLRGQRQPLSYPATVAGAGSDGLAGDWRWRGCGQVMVHGATAVGGTEGSFFTFLDIPGRLSPSYAKVLDLIMPHLHFAFFRQLANEAGDESATLAPVPESLLSPREAEVLGWVREGKTNQQIGAALNISPFTVKNHVQKILRKLGVRNRTQAVAQGGAAAVSPGGATGGRGNELLRR